MNHNYQTHFDFLYLSLAAERESESAKEPTKTEIERGAWLQKHGAWVKLIIANSVRAVELNYAQNVVRRDFLRHVFG